MSESLNPHALATLIMIGAALILFAQDKIRLETSSLIVLFVLTLGFQVFPYTLEDQSNFNPIDFFLGFGHEALLAICCLMILGRGIEKTGAMKPLIGVLTVHWSRSPKLCLVITLLVSALFSGFLNNTPIVVMLIPVLISVAQSNSQSASKILMPMGLATLIGGTATTIGTSTNLLIVSVARDLGSHEFGLFDFALPVAIVGGFGLLYLSFIAPLLLPDRRLPLEQKESRIFKAVLMITNNSVINGKTLAETIAMTDHKIKISRIIRGKNQLITLPTVTLKEGDGLIVSGNADELMEYSHIFKAQLYEDVGLKKSIEKSTGFTQDDQVLAEILVTEGSFLERKTLKQVRFSHVHELLVLALHRLYQPQNIAKSISETELHRGDILLVQGTPEKLERLKNNSRILLLSSKINLVASHKAPLALAIMLLVIVVAATNLLPISISALGGVGLMLLTKCINWTEIARALNPSVIMIIVVSLALGKAMLVTDADSYLSSQFLNLTQNLPSVVTLGALIFLMAVITNVVSNTAAAVIGTPVAINIAQALNAAPEAFILAVLFGVNMSYATPIGYQTNLLIYSVGGYKFSDFIKVGLPLTLLMGLGFTLVLSLLYNI
ncbi:SLC13 family permease [Aliikangiella sp. IMCC44653]